MAVPSLPQTQPQPQHWKSPVYDGEMKLAERTKSESFAFLFLS